MQGQWATVAWEWGTEGLNERLEEGWEPYAADRGEVYLRRFEPADPAVNAPAPQATPEPVGPKPWRTSEPDEQQPWDEHKPPQYFTWPDVPTRQELDAVVRWLVTMLVYLGRKT